MQTRFNLVINIQIFVYSVGNAFGSGALKPMETVAVPESFPPILKHFTKIIIKMELQKLVLHPVSNPLLQTLLLVLHKKDPKLCMKLCKAVMSQIDMFSSKKEKVMGPRKSRDDDKDQGAKEERWVGKTKEESSVTRNPNMSIFENLSIIIHDSKLLSSCLKVNKLKIS